MNDQWTDIILGDLVDGYRGVSYKPAHLLEERMDNSVILLRANNIQNGQLKYDNIQIVPNRLVKENQLLKQGDIAVCMSNGSKALVGKSAQYKGEQYSQCTIGAFCSVFKPKKNTVKEFIIYLFGSQAYQRHIDISLAGSAINNLKNSDIEAIAFTVPSEKKQKKVATILATIDQTIEKTEALIHKYQQIKAGLMHDLFTRGLTADGKLRSPREQAPELYQETPIGWIPKEWKVKSAGELCRSIVPGRDKPILDRGDLPWITVSDIESLYVFESLEGLSLSRSSLKKAHGRTIPKGAVVMSCVGAFGLVAIAGKELVINQQLHGFVVGDQVISEWFVYNIERQERYMNKIATQTTILYLNKAACESIPIIVPTKKEQQQLVETIKAISDRINIEQQVVLKLKKQKFGLMHDLLTGKVPVKLDQAEPTHV